MTTHINRSHAPVVTASGQPVPAGGLVDLPTAIPDADRVLITAGVLAPVKKTAPPARRRATKKET